MLEFWGMQSTPSLPLLPGLLGLWVLAADSVLSMGQIELNSVLKINWIAWNRTALSFKLRTYVVYYSCVLMNNEEHVYTKNIRLYFYSWRWYLCGAEEQSQKGHTHMKGSPGVGRASEQLTLAKIQELI